MTTRVGTQYKPQEEMGSEGDRKSLEEMMAQLIEDRRKREEEIAAERAQREAEITAEWKRREEEREAREREVKLQMDAMQAQMERLMKVVEDSTATTAAKSVGGELSGVKLVPLSEKDDIEAYLVTFERIMEAHKIERGRWAHYLAPQLTGRAQLAFAALPTAVSGKYESIKAAILQRYDINEEAYRRRFRSAARGAGETNREHTVKLMDLQRKWLKEYTILEQMQEAIGLEQFLNSLPMDERVWVYERKPKTCVEAGELADEYEQVRKQEPGIGLQPEPMTGVQSSRSLPGSLERPGEGSSVKEESAGEAAGRSMETGLEDGKCFGCRKFGHVRENCPNNNSVEKVLFAAGEKHESSS